MRQVRPLSTRVTAALLAVITAFSCVPTQALAEVASVVEPEATSQVDVAPAADDAADGAVVGDNSAAAGGDTSARSASSSGDGEKSVDVEESAGATDAASVVANDGPDSDDAAARSSYVTLDSVEIVNESGENLTYASRTAKVGDVVKVAAYYEDDWGDDEEITSDEYARLTYQWYIGEKQSSAPTASGYTALEGQTNRELTLTADMAGKYVACEVTYGSSSWDYEFTPTLKNAIKAAENPNVSPDAKTLAEVVRQLSSWRPDPSFGADTNIVDMLSAKLEELGYANVTPTLKSVSFTATDSAAQGGIADDGSITYFFLSNADKTTYSDYSALRQFKPTYTLSLGSESVEFTPGLASTLAWDTAKVEDYLGEKLDQAEIPASVTAGKVDSSTKEETLPGVIYENGKKVATIEWSSSNDSAAKLTTSYDDNYNTVYKVAYTHGGSATNVTLTAKVSLFVSGYGNAPSTGATKRFSITVAPKSAEEIAAERDELEAALGRITLRDFATKDEVDPASVGADLQLPRAGRSGIDAPSGAKLSYSSDNEAVAKVNGYHVIITRDIEGGTNEATITATLTKDGVTATRDIKIAVTPVSDAEIDEAVAFMQQVKDDYANALLGENASVDDVQSDLARFYEATPADDGSVSYARTMADNTLTGVVADDLPGYDSMSGTTWRTYRSSDASVVADETLRVTRPEADTLVTVTGSLTYERYRALAEAHPENAKLQSLVNQEVTATYRVTGTKTHEDPQISVGFQLVGAAADGSGEVWFDGSRQVAFGSTADALIEDVLGQLGLAHTSGTGQYGYYLSDVTSSDGRTLGYDATTGRYWQLFVNGVASDASASGVTLRPGDSVVLYYSAYGASLDDINNATVRAQVSFVGPDANGNASVWYSSGDVSMPNGSTAADLTVRGLEGSGLAYTLMTPESDGYFYLSDITSSDGRKLGWDQQTGRYWQLYVNGTYSQEGAEQVTLKPGDVVQYVYAADGEKPLDGVVVNPSAPRPDWTADWSGFGNSGSTTLTNVPTPSESAEVLWKVGLATDEDPWVSLGDPIVAGGYVFVTTNTDLVKIDSSGTVVGRVPKGGRTSYFSRPVYADGLIVSANDDGSLCAFSAETLECVWRTPALGTPSVGGSYQSNSTMTVANGCVYAEFVAGVSSTGTASEGVMRCVDLATGSVRWERQTVRSGDSTGEGYYWAGACASGSDLVIGDESGCVRLVDGETGEVRSSVSLGGNPCRATVVSAGAEGGRQVYLVVGRSPATLYKVVRDGDSLSVAGSCEFGSTSTSTPAVAGGKVYVGGSDALRNGRLTVIDLATMTVERSVDMGANAEVKASPLVSVQGEDTYVYFTSNKTPGSLYRFSQRTGEVAEVYTPSGSERNYCTASVVADDEGNLYYTNDSGTVFALRAAAGYRVDFDSNGGSSVPSAMPVRNKPMAAVAEPVREGYRFLGWFTADGSKWDFSQPVTGDMTLYARWEGTSGSDSPEGGAPEGGEKGPAPTISLASGTGGEGTLTSQVPASDGEAAPVGGADAGDAPAGDSSAAEATSAGSASAVPTSVGGDGGAQVVSQAGVPLWPFVGMAVGVAAIALLLVLPGRRGKGGER